jgi:ATP-dependent DNA helicase RecG
VLVATTVIEVGVDVPNASLMVIEHAERFGLAQLHQLRGRVGRGAAASVCVLLYASPCRETGRERLKAIYETTDGFEIARRDLHPRPRRVHGRSSPERRPLLRYADLDPGRLVLELRAGRARGAEAAGRQARRAAARGAADRLLPRRTAGLSRAQPGLRAGLLARRARGLAGHPV